MLVCSGNCPEWYRVTEYKFVNQTRSDCINAFVYGINDSTVIQRNRRIYYSTFFVIGYALPLTIICVLYVLLVHRIGGRVGGHTGDVHGMSVQTAATRRRVMKMVTAVIITFAVCWLPMHVAFLVEAFANVDEYYTVELVVFQIVATCLAYTNSCLNPVIYAFLSENFRQSFKELLAVGGNGVDRRGMSGVGRSSKGGSRHKPGDRSVRIVDGHLAVPMVPINFSTPNNELSKTLSVAL